VDATQFDTLVARLEQESTNSPSAYQTKVALLALLGFGILALILGFAGLALFLLAGLAVALLFTGGKAIILVLKLGKLLIFLAIPLWLLVKSSLSALFARFPKPEGEEIVRSQAPALFDAMDQMRSKMRGPLFHHVLVTDEMNAAVVQRPLLGLFGLPRNYLILGLPLLESLSPDEALAVVAHEYGHLAGSHSRFGAFIYRLRNTWSTIQDLSGQWQGWAGKALQRIVQWYAPYFNAYTFVLARANEYQADAASAELVSPGVAASALKRVNIAGAAHDRFMDTLLNDAREQREPPADVAERWSRAAVVYHPAEQATKWLTDSLGRERKSHDTHPVLRDRLGALPGQAEQVEVLPEALQGDTAAKRWLGEHAAALRRKMQTQWQVRVEEPWRARHDAFRSQMQRLEALRALSAPSVEEQMERFKLQIDVEPNSDHVPDLAAFNQVHPEQPLTLYLEGSLRVDRDDEMGIALLERAMAIDADATKPACEKIYAFHRRRQDDVAAEPFAKRWNERHEWELLRQEQANTFDLRHEVREPGLNAQMWMQVQALVRSQAKGVARAWIVRRVLPADASLESYVLCIELSTWARLRSRGPKVIEGLAALQWPLSLFVCTFEGANKTLKDRVLRLAGAEIALKD
jgi:Zn-dependent protease with chaperone function